MPLLDSSSRLISGFASHHTTEIVIIRLVQGVRDESSSPKRHNPPYWLSEIMSATLTKVAIQLVKPVVPYLTILPTPILTLVPTLAFHYTTTTSPSPFTFFHDPIIHPLHPPLLLTFILIPIIYLLGLVSGNVSWVDRSWPFFTPVCSMMVLLWGVFSPSAGVYGHNLPRLTIMMGLQVSESL